MVEKGRIGRPITRKESADGTELECTGCRQMLPRGQFAEMAASRTGKAYRCRGCRRELRARKRKPATKRTSAAVGRPRTREQRDGGELLGCSRCGEILHRNLFYSSRSTPSGKAYACKTCTREYRKARYRHATRAAIAEKTPKQQCIQCLENLPHTRFTLMKTSKSGLCPVCRSCVADKSAKGGP